MTTRRAALEYLGSVHPLLPAYAVLAEALGREAVEAKARAVEARLAWAGGDVRFLYGEGEVEDALALLCLRTRSRLERGLAVALSRDDLPVLLSADHAQARTLGIRLLARTHE
jgi:hypothetical protein